jgi:hypothetical protein
MPIHHGRTKSGIKSAIGKNIKMERRLGVPKKQAIAIALSIARKDAGKAHRSLKSVGLKRYRRK